MTDNFVLVKRRLHNFIRKYHFNELLKGMLLFTGIGLLYLIFVSVLENFLWFGTEVRSVLFWLTIGLQSYLFVRFVFIPVLRLFNLRRGLGEKEASIVLGEHFKEVDDKLLNVLQLGNSSSDSELLLASIDQKCEGLKFIPFNKAISLRAILKYAFFALVPITVLGVAYLFNAIDWFNDGYGRIRNYNVSYSPPAPFNFVIVNDSLTAVTGKEFILDVITVGDVVPEVIQIETGTSNYYMRSVGVGKWQYVFNNIEDFGNEFRFRSADVVSQTYKLKVLKAPKLISLDLFLNYPDYTGHKDKWIKNSGNAIVPEGTQIRWNAKVLNATEVKIITGSDEINCNSVSTDIFVAEKRLFENFAYNLVTGSKELKEFEKLGYAVQVIKDEYPVINVNLLADTINVPNKYINIRYSDDYGVNKLKLMYFDVNQPDRIIEENISYESKDYGGRTLVFPGDRNLKQGHNYKYYVEVVDNDQIHNGKSAKSALFAIYMPKEDEIEEELLKQQEKVVSDFDKGIDKVKEGLKNIEEFNQEQKQKRSMSFNDRQELSKVLKRQGAQQSMMKKFSKQLENNLNKIDSDINDDKLLKERLERQRLEMERNEELMKELEKLAGKISNEELTKKLDEIAKQQQSSERSLEQLLELTKRYYVSAKAEKLADDLERLSSLQDSLGITKNVDNELKEQEKLSERFEELSKELEDLNKSNNDLKKPLDLDLNNKDQEDIKDNQKNAEELIREDVSNPENKMQNETKSNNSQRKAARGMKELSDKLKNGLQSGSGEAMEEDAEMLRQILDNLVLFSFDQERLLTDIGREGEAGAAFARRLREQNELRTLFKHVDDSLFALSLRRPEIGEAINKEITEVYYNMDEALDRLAENRIYQGVASQQYVVTSSNTLADMLSKVLDSMQASIGNSSGRGGKDFQLPDIIKSQGELKEMMKGTGKKGKGKEASSGKQGKGNGEPGNEGKENESGKKGSKGTEGNNGNSGTKSGSGYSEEISEELYEMFKRQQQIRTALEEQLNDKIGAGAKAIGKSAIQQMEMIEQELLNNGLSDRLNQMLKALEYQLLKMENAAQEQGKKDDRESNTNTKNYTNKANEITPDIKQYFEQLEILNRQVLPLRQIYKGKVNEYFRK